MPITEKLWDSNYELAELSFNTKFVQGLKSGNLPKHIFQEYLAQDYFFLETLQRHMVWQFLNLKINIQ